jgi:pimeloyl-ACP methyl ester carboxylesterase
MKGRALAERLAERGVALECVDLRVPEFGRMRVAAMLERSREALGDAESAVVIGTSFGGLIAALLASADPRVEALVLFAPALHAGDLRRRYPLATWAWERIGWLPLWDKTERRLRAVEAGFLRELDGLGPRLPDVRVPTLLVHGTRDRLVPLAVSRDFARGLSQVRLVEYADGHRLRASLPAAIAELERFLAPWMGAQR